MILEDVAPPSIYKRDFDKVMNYKVSSQIGLPYTVFSTGFSKLLL